MIRHAIPTTWRRYFPHHILERGYDYFQDNAVADVSTKKNRTTAIVYGSDDYEVEITFKRDSSGQMDIDDMYCTCPHAEEGNYCKHMAALLFELESGHEQEYAHALTDGTGSWQESQLVQTGQPDQSGQTAEDQVRTIVMQADEKTVKNFLTAVLQADERLFIRFKSLAVSELSPEDLQKYKNQVNACIEKYAGRYGFIEYRQARSFIQEIEDFLDEDVQTMLEDGHLKEAFELTNHIFLQISDVDMDDSDGGQGLIGQYCAQIWIQLAAQGDKPLKDTMFQWLTSHLDSQVMDYMVEFIEQALMQEFVCSPYIEQLLDFTEEKARQAGRRHGSEDDPWEWDGAAAQWAQTHINLMELQGSSWESIQEYCRRYWKHWTIRDYFIQECRRREEYDAAIKAIKESLSMAAQYRGRDLSLELQLKELYQITGNGEAYKNQLWKLVTKLRPGDMDEYRELKSLYEPEEWPAVRDKILAALPKGESKDPYYAEENMYEQLLESVLNEQGVYKVNQYVEDLKDIYPKELLQRYSETLSNSAKRAAGRREYQQWVRILRIMQTIPGGREEVERIVQTWKQLYRNRRAMMDELSGL